MIPKISAIAAIGEKTRAICEDQKLLWVIPDDHKRMKELTMGHTLLMGRKTYDSIRRPLPGRISVIVTRNREYQPEIPTGSEKEIVKVCYSTEEGLQEALKLEEERHPENGEVFVFGGGEIYQQALPKTERLYLTIVKSDKEGDAHFPNYSEFTKVLEKEEKEDTEQNLKYSLVTLERP